MEEENKAKEMALELIKTFKPYSKVVSSGFFVANEDTSLNSAIQCSIKCCESHIDDLSSWRVKYWLTLEHAMEMSVFWKEVIKELEKM